MLIFNQRRRRMLSYERQQQILELLKQERFVTVPYLCKKLYSSSATIRRDLQELHDVGQLRRVRGGATTIESFSEDAPFLLRTNTELEKKKSIASLALSYIKDSDILLFDSSSTVTALAKLLNGHKHLTVVTNGLVTLSVLNEHPSMKLYAIGGRIQNQSSMVGPDALSMIGQYYADKLFFSCCGLSTGAGITEANEENARIKREMLLHAKEKILLCDSTKLGKTFFSKTCEITDIDMIITDRKPDSDMISLYQNRVSFVFPS